MHSINTLLSAIPLTYASAFATLAGLLLLVSL